MKESLCLCRCLYRAHPPFGEYLGRVMAGKAHPEGPTAQDLKVISHELFLALFQPLKQLLSVQIDLFKLISLIPQSLFSHSCLVVQSSSETTFKYPTFEIFVLLLEWEIVIHVCSCGLDSEELDRVL